ncbi:MAG: UDP-galacturonate 4-epimerase [Gemmatimonadetes bacterium]|nr:UDP-galacturonate 4-epimerase [Gemmatimonadota bacterium]
MRFLITGGAGFIGSHLVEHLLERGEDVVVLDDFSTGRRSNVSQFLDRITLLEGSITDESRCRQAMKGVDFVLHQAALSSVPRSVNDPRSSHEVNATGTLNLLVAARDEGVKRFVYAASSSAYGNTAELPKHEGMPSRPLSPYAVAKLAAENYCRAFFLTYGLPTVALRYFNIYGARQDPNSQYSAVIPRFITAAMQEKAPMIFGDGEQTRDFTYVGNAVVANMLACAAGSSAFGEVFNVGCGDRISVNELWRQIRELVGANVEAVYETGRAGDVRDSLASLARSRELLGYHVATPLEEGLRLTVSAYLAEAR